MTEPEIAVDAYANLEKKDLYELGEFPPLGHVPQQMYAWAIRRERHGDPDKAMLCEIVDVPTLDSHEVLIMVMATTKNAMAEILCFPHRSGFEGTRPQTVPSPNSPAFKPNNASPAPSI